MFIYRTKPPNLGGSTAARLRFDAAVVTSPMKNFFINPVGFRNTAAVSETCRNVCACGLFKGCFMGCACFWAHFCEQTCRARALVTHITQSPVQYIARRRQDVTYLSHPPGLIDVLVIIIIKMRQNSSSSPEDSWPLLF